MIDYEVEPINDSGGKKLLPTTNSTWACQGLNLGLYGERLKSNQLRNGMAVYLSGMSIVGIKSNFVKQY
jgi:hypothetical protein